MKSTHPTAIREDKPTSTNTSPHNDDVPQTQTQTQRIPAVSSPAPVHSQTNEITDVIILPENTIEPTNESGQTRFYVALKHNELDLCKELINESNIKATTNKGHTILTAICKSNHATIDWLFAQDGVLDTIDNIDHLRCTPLMHCVNKNSFIAVQRLLKNGSDISLINAKNENTYEAARSNKMRSLLKSHGACNQVDMEESGIRYSSIHFNGVNENLKEAERLYKQAVYEEECRVKVVRRRKMEEENFTRTIDVLSNKVNSLEEMIISLQSRLNKFKSLEKRVNSLEKKINNLDSTNSKNYLVLDEKINRTKVEVMGRFDNEAEEVVVATDEDDDGGGDDDGEDCDSYEEEEVEEKGEEKNKKQSKSSPKKRKVSNADVDHGSKKIKFPNATTGTEYEYNEVLAKMEAFKQVLVDNGEDPVKIWEKKKDKAAST